MYQSNLQLFAQYNNSFNFFLNKSIQDSADPNLKPNLYNNWIIDETENS